VSYWSAAHVRSVALAEASRLTLRRFLPAELVDASPKRALELVSTPKTVNATVLVSDLRGFTAMSETLPPARVLEGLNEVQGAFAAAVRARGGVVDKFMGDGMLAVFGAFQPMPDHCARALGAALDMRRALSAVNAARAARGEPELGMGIGVHAGPLIAGCLGSGARLEMTVIGDTVNIASRLEAHTKEKGVDVLVSEDAALSSGVPTEPLGEVALRGRRQPLRVHQLPP
jgi:adenylate cyclase